MPGGIPVPVDVILSWPPTNRVDPQTAGSAFIISTGIFGIIALVVVSARMWARFVILKSPNIDDYLILAAVPPTALTVALTWLCVGPYQWDHHTWDVTVANIINGRRAIYVLQIVYVLASSLIKIAVLFFYRHLALRTFSPWFKNTVRACIVSVVIFLIVYVFVVIFCCTPVSAFWMQFNHDWAAQHPYKCISSGAPSVIASATSLVQDFIAVVLPLSMFVHLKMRKGQKIALMAVFALGLFTCVAAFMRVYYIYRIYYSTYDGTWESYRVFVWVNIELLSAMICASAPSLKIFIRTIRTPPSTAHETLSRQHTLTGPQHLLTTQKSAMFSTKSGFLTSSDRSSSNESAFSVVKKVPKEARIYDMGVPWYKEDFLDMENDLEMGMGEGTRGGWPRRKCRRLSALEAAHEEDEELGQEGQANNVASCSPVVEESEDMVVVAKGARIKTVVEEERPLSTTPLQHHDESSVGREVDDV